LLLRENRFKRYARTKKGSIKMTKEKLFNKLKNRGIFWSYSKELTYYEIEAIGLFGSYARAEATRESDIDIFVQILLQMIEKDIAYV